jgi:hypothetical protein
MSPRHQYWYIEYTKDIKFTKRLDLRLTKTMFPITFKSQCWQILSSHETFAISTSFNL